MIIKIVLNLERIGILAYFMESDVGLCLYDMHCKNKGRDLIMWLHLRMAFRPQLSSW